ncbi:MAG: YHS domain-containing protein, partial [bacterium]|nr:YHS domain-containing protein [bacterium]
GVGYILYKWLWKGENPWPFKSRKKKDYASAPKAIEEMKKDPVCGTYVPQHEAVKDRVNSTDYYFCSEECKLKFRELQTAKRETSK